MTLNQKETTLLQDLKSQEQLCVDKYSKYSSDASDGTLKNLFTQLGQTEQRHLETIGKILGGTVPASSSSSGSSSGAQSASAQVGSNRCTAEEKQKDKYLCSDALSMEKHVSSVYDTCIFEFRDTNIRDTLNHIQKEEQGHGERLYNYMAQNGMYSG